MKISKILDGKELYFDDPSCGFDSDVSIEINGNRYALACDSCGITEDCSSGKFLGISDGERAIIEAIFEKHGGTFPCV